MRFAQLCMLILLLASCRKKPSSGGLLLPQLDSIKTIPLAASAGKVDSLPPRTDMQPALPPVGDQGQQGSCVSWALGYNLISYYEKYYSHQPNYGEINGVADPSRVYSPAFVYNYLKQGVIPEECKTGIDYSSAFKVIESQGICRWKELPYKEDLDGCKGGISSTVLDSSRLHNGYTFERINNSIQDIKFYTSLGYPIIVGIFTSKNLYEKALNVPKGSVFIWSPANTDRDEYHAMLIVGYDSKNFKLMNSWGANWGTDGYVLIPYKKLLSRSIEFYICKKKIITEESVVNYNYKNLGTLRQSGFKAALPNNVCLFLDQASMSIKIPDTSKEDVLFHFYDSSQRTKEYRTYLKKGEEKQFYISDSLITITSHNTHQRKHPIGFTLTIDSGRLDDNLRGIDSMLQATFQYLRKKSNPSDQDKELLNQFELWNSGYRQKNYEYKSANQFMWVAISLVAFILSVFVLLLWIKKIKARKKQRKTHL